MQFKDYYQILGVSREATADELKKAFRRLARKYHPDVSKEPDAEARMQEINEAYTVLSDPGKRAAYDQLGQNYHPGQEFRAPPGWDAGFEFSDRGFSTADAAGFSDFFAELFGQMGGGRHGFRAGGRQRAQGEDHHAKILLDIEDSFSGAVRQLDLRVPQLDAGGRMAVGTRSLKVRIPRGVRAGQIIRLAGQGGPGVGGLPPGDLLLTVAFKPHPRYTVDGTDLCVELPVTPWEAALGAVIPVDLPGGRIKLRIPEGAQNGGQLRVRGQGLPATPPGDARLTLKIVLPAADTPKARRLYEDMARELAFDPRHPRE